MKLELELDRSSGSLRLFSAAFWKAAAETNTKPDTELFDEAMADNRHGPEKRFRWGATERAFCLLLLRAYLGGKPWQARLAGGPGSSARSLVEILGDKSTKGSTGRTWLQRLFSTTIQQGAEDPRVPRSLFHWKPNTTLNHFEVALGEAWRNADIVVRLHGNIASKREAAFMINELEEQQPPKYDERHVPRLTGSIELRFWDPQRGQLLPIQSCNFPVSVASGVSLRMHFVRPAYPYVIWFSAAGHVQPLYPWEDFDWKKQSRPSPTVEFTLPETNLADGSRFYPIESRPGIETALVLASERRAPPDFAAGIEKTCDKLQRCLPKVLPDAKQVYWLSDPRIAFTDRPAFRLGQPKTPENPMGKWIDDMVQHSGNSFPCIFGVCFSTKGAS